MTLVNAFYERAQVTRAEFKDFLILLDPFAPHICEELWQRNGYPQQIAHQKWVQWDEAKAIEDVVDVPVQINGKLRGTVSVRRDATQEDVRSTVWQDESIAKSIAGKAVVKEVYVPGRIYSLVVK
jgi:leucyl-tRNA synthetase